MAEKEIHNAQTGEIVRRELDADELAQAKLDRAQAIKDAATQAAKQAARQAVLDKLGLTADEASALFG